MAGGMGGGMMMRHAQAPAAVAEGTPMFECPMMAGGAKMGQAMQMMQGRMGMMHSRMGMPGAGMMAPGVGRLFQLYGDKIEVIVENSKDGAALKITSKDPEVIKAIQVHMPSTCYDEDEGAARRTGRDRHQAPAESACCADCARKKWPRGSCPRAFFLVDIRLTRANLPGWEPCWNRVRISFSKRPLPASWSISSNATPTS
jgi:hypothetical protein